jgi:dihydrofolate reductase
MMLVATPGHSSGRTTTDPREIAMRKLIYSMGVSLDGFIAGPDGAIDWSAPDPELHRFFNEQTREVDLELYGRGLYEDMQPWEQAERRPDPSAEVLAFAKLWRATPKVVFSTTLDAVEGNARLVTTDAVAEVQDLKDQPGGDLAVGGAGLAATFIAAGLVDEYRQFVHPVVLGGGTPYFPPLDRRIGLELLETKTFSSRVVYLRYRAT